MKYFVFSLLLLVLFSCEKNDTVEYRIEQSNTESLHSITLFDKNNSKIGEFNLDGNGSLISYAFNNRDKFHTIVNFDENGIVSYLIGDGNGYSNQTNLHNGQIVRREERINENVVYIEGQNERKH
ncbi:MAG: hypothetical protein LBV17_09490 [Treponema sp.]|jgi:hypothetical protein|nr:hypothetical protein [Treponema sp.]